MDLKKIVPQESSFYLRLAERSFTMRPINLEDEIWLENEYPGSKVQDIFENLNMPEISRIVFRLIKNEDKEFFKKQSVKIVNEEGEEMEVDLGGVKLLTALISGWDEKATVINSLLANIGFSRPDLDKEEAGDDKEKKSLKR